MHLLSQAFKAEMHNQNVNVSHIGLTFTHTHTHIYMCVCVKNTAVNVSYCDIKIITCGGDAVCYATHVQMF